MHSRQEGTVKWFDDGRGIGLLGVQCSQGTSLVCQGQLPASQLSQVFH